MYGGRCVETSEGVNKECSYVLHYSFHIAFLGFAVDIKGDDSDDSIKVVVYVWMIVLH